MERAVIVDSYQRVFAKLPEQTNEWEDVIKMASSQTPTERNLGREQAAEKLFKTVYRGAPQRDFGSADDKAVTMIAYGLLPLRRSLSSEVKALKTYSQVFKHLPKSGDDWNVLRAVVYSGAKK